MAAAVGVAVISRDDRQLAVAAEPSGASGLRPSPRSGVGQLPVTLTVFRGNGGGAARVARATRRCFEGHTADASTALRTVPWAQTVTAATRVATPAARDTYDLFVRLDQVASTTTTMRYDHDLDSGETDARPTGGSSVEAKIAAIKARQNGSASVASSLNPQGRRAMDKIASDRAQAARGKARRRSSSRHDKLNESPAQLPELVVMQEPL